MESEPEVSFKRGSSVWVWDSTWLPAVVVCLPAIDCVSVRLEHGVTFSVAVANLVARDPAYPGNEIPHPRHGLHAWRRSEPQVAIQKRVGNYVTDPSHTASLPAGPHRGA
jgi:hypothetical protein